ncbi:MAG TPA: DinB family protein [Flavitalea sp.]|nr:DinB family protein [Flavitalea sp.]
MKEIIETWEINNRINLYLLESVKDEHLSSVAASKGRTVGEQFAHIHNVRLMWLKAAMPDLLNNVEKIENNAINKRFIAEQLSKSSKVISQLFEKSLAEGKLKGFKPHPAAFLGYIISHESHHRGQIVLSLKQSNHPVDKKILFGLWEWGAR